LGTGLAGTQDTSIHSRRVGRRITTQCFSQLHTYLPYTYLTVRRTFNTDSLTGQLTTGGRGQCRLSNPARSGGGFFTFLALRSVGSDTLTTIDYCINVTRDLTPPRPQTTSVRVCLIFLLFLNLSLRRFDRLLVGGGKKNIRARPADHHIGHGWVRNPSIANWTARLVKKLLLRRTVKPNLEVV
jgi:hypothetical protein